MNSVHEPGPNGDSKTISSRKTRLKTKPGARAPNWPSWPSLPAQAALAWPCRGRFWPCRGRAPWPCRSAPSVPCLPRALAPSCLQRPPARPTNARLRAPRAPSACPCCIATQAFPKLTIQTCCPPNCIAIQFLQQPGSLYCNTLDPLAIQFQPSKLPSLQYNNCIAIQFQAKFTHLAIQSHSFLPYCLQHNFNIAIQFFFHNIIGQ